MLFYTSIKNIEKIPTTHIVLLVTKETLATIHPSAIDFKELFPKSDMTREEYFKYIQSEKMHMTFSIMLWIQNKNVDVVLVYDDVERESVGFNYCKLICTFIERRYEYPFYKFTNDTTLSMKRDSRLSDRGINKYSKDLIKHSKAVDNVS